MRYDLNFPTYAPDPVNFPFNACGTSATIAVCNCIPDNVGGCTSNCNAGAPVDLLGCK